MKNLNAIKPFEEDNFFTSYRKRLHKKIIKDNIFPNVNVSNIRTKNKSIQIGENFKTFFRISSLPNNKNIIIDKTVKTKTKYNKKNYLLSIKYLSFLKQEDLTDDYIELLNLTNEVNTNDEFMIKKIKEKERLKEELKKLNFKKKIEALSELDNIPKQNLEKSVQYIYEKVQNSKNINKTIEKPKFIVHNVFFDWILFSVLHKIEIKNQLNQTIKQEYILNLLKDEIQNIQDKVINFVVKDIKSKQRDLGVETIEAFNKNEDEIFMTLKRKYNIKQEINSDNLNDLKIDLHEKNILKKIVKRKRRLNFRNERNLMLNNYNSGKNLTQYDSSMNNNNNFNRSNIYTYNNSRKNSNSNMNNNFINNNNNNNDNNDNNNNNNYYYNIYSQTINVDNYHKGMNLTKKDYYSKKISRNNKEIEIENNIKSNTILTPIKKNNNINEKISSTEHNSYLNTFTNSLFDTKRTTNSINFKSDDEEKNNNRSQRNFISIYDNKDSIKENKTHKKLKTLDDIIQDKVDFDKKGILNSINSILNKKHSKNLKVNQNFIIKKKNENMVDENEGNKLTERSRESDVEFSNFVKRESLKLNNDTNNKDEVNENNNNNSYNNHLNTININSINTNIMNTNNNTNNNNNNNFENINDKNNININININNINNNNIINNNTNNNNITNNNDNIDNKNNNYDNNDNKLSFNSPERLNENTTIENENNEEKKSTTQSPKKKKLSSSPNKNKEKEGKKDEKEDKKIEKINKISEKENLKIALMKKEEIKRKELEKEKLERMDLLKKKEKNELNNLLTNNYSSFKKEKNNPYLSYQKNKRAISIDQIRFLRKIFFQSKSKNNFTQRRSSIFQGLDFENMTEEDLINESERLLKIALEDENIRKLIYDNSYLFKNRNEHFSPIIRDEVMEILNGNYRIEKKIIVENKKKKTYSPKKKKKNVNKEYVFEKSGLKMTLNYDFNKYYNDDEEEEKMKKNLEEKREEELHKNIGIPYEVRLKQFFEKIKALKEGNNDKFDEEIDNLIEEQIEDNEVARNRRREVNLKNFNLTLNVFRSENKKLRNMKTEKLHFRNPCEFDIA